MKKVKRINKNNISFQWYKHKHTNGNSVMSTETLFETNTDDNNSSYYWSRKLRGLWCNVQKILVSYFLS